MELKHALVIGGIVDVDQLSGYAVWRIRRGLGLQDHALAYKELACV
jgi:hypothetical protein